MYFSAIAGPSAAATLGLLRINLSSSFQTAQFAGQSRALGQIGFWNDDTND
jgi:hypothetical protein